MSTSFSESATTATGSRSPLTVYVESINSNFAQADNMPKSFPRSNASSAVPSQVPTTCVEQINPNYIGLEGYDKDTIYVVPSFNVPQSKWVCPRMEQPDLDTEPGVSERRFKTSIFHHLGRVIDDGTKEFLYSLLDETVFCEEGKCYDIATLEKEAVPPAGHYLATLERTLRECIPSSLKMRLLDAKTHESEMGAHGFVKFGSPATSRNSSDTGSDSEEYEDKNENPVVSSDEEDDDDEEEEDITYYPEQSGYMSEFDSRGSS